MIFNVSRWILLFFIFTHCDSKSVLRYPHERAKPDGQWRVNVSNDIDDCEELLGSKNLPTSVCRFQNADLTKEDFLELYNLFQLSSFLKDPAINSRQMTARLIWSLNNYAVQSSDEVMVARLVSLMRQDCHQFAEEQCLYFKLFASVHNTRDVFLKYLENSKNKKDLEDIFILAFRATHAGTGTRLLEIFTQRVPDLKYNQNLALILESSQREALDARAKSKINSYLYQDSLRLSDLTTKEEILEAVDQFKKKYKTNELRNTWKDLQQRRPLLVNALKLSSFIPDSTMEIYNLIYEQIIVDRESSRALSLLGEDQALLESFNKYVQIRLAIEIDQKDQLVRKAVESNNVNSSEFSQRLNEKLDVIRHGWLVTASKLANVALWVSGGLKNANNKSIPKKYLSGLGETIRTYSEYPHMFYIAYAHNRVGASLSLVRATAKINLPTKKLFANILYPPQGKMYLSERVVWFEYTNRSEAASQIVIQNAFLYFVSSGAFQTLGIDSEKFFTYVVSSLYGEYVDIPRQRLLNIDKFYEYNSDYKDYKNFCDDFMAGRPVRRVLEFERLRKRFLTGSFSEDVLEIINFGGESNSSVTSGGLPFDLTTAFDLQEYANTDLNKVRDFLVLTEKRLLELKQSPSFIHGMITEVEQLKSAAEQSIAEYVERGRCFARILEEERAILSYVVEKEEAYLRQVYRDMKALQAVETPQQAHQILKRYQKSYLFEPLAQRGIKPLDRISSQRYFYSQFDLLGRISHYLRSYSSKVKLDVRLPEVIYKTPSYSLVAKGLGQSNWLSYSSSLTEEEFINEAYRTFQNETYFVGWNDRMSIGSRLTRYQFYILNLVSSMRLKTNFPLRDVLVEYRKMLKYIQLSETEKRLLQASRRDMLWLPVQLSEWFLDIKVRESSLVDTSEVTGSKDIVTTKKDKIDVVYITRLYGVFDSIFEEFNQDVLGFDYYVERLRAVEQMCVSGSGCTSDYETSKKYRLGPYAKALELYLSLQNANTKGLIFPLDQNLVQDAYLQFRNEVLEKEKQSETFLEEIQKTFLPTQDYIDISLSLKIDGPAVSKRSKSKVDGNKADFHLQTQNCFRSNKKLCFVNEHKSTSGSAQ